MVKSMRFRTLNATGGLGVQSLARGLGGLGCIGVQARGFRAMTKMFVGAADVTLVVLRFGRGSEA